MLNHDKKKVLVIGSRGMLASAMIEALNGHSSIELTVAGRTAPRQSEVKFVEFDILGAPHNFYGYDYIVNCAGVIKPYINDSDAPSVGKAFQINTLFPISLEKYCKTGTRILQIATDCVYSGASSEPYNESARADATDAYGITKLCGERKCKNFYNIRSSIIGREYDYYKSLVSWAISQKGKTVNGFTNHLWNGVTTKAFSAVIKGIIEHDTTFSYQTTHLIPADVVTKYELLQQINEALDLNLTIIPTEAAVPINRVLSTCDTRKNSELWDDAFFGSVPKIHHLVKNYL